MFGCHLNTTKGFLSTVDYAKSLNINFFQIFLASPRQYFTTRKSREQLEALRNKLLENNMKIVVHGNYMLNFCNPPDSEKYTLAFKNLKQDLEEASIVGDVNLGVIIHMGSRLKMPEKEAINNYVNAIKKMLKETPENTTIILETGAGEGTEVCTLISDLGKMYRMFTKDELKRIKICIDTCHCFAAGEDLSTANGIENFIELVQDHLDWINVVCVHLNDSEKGCGCKKDRHADLLQGCIQDGLRVFAKFLYENGIPFVTETPCKNYSRQKQLEIINKWIL